jgi:hypothetical protein
VAQMARGSLVRAGRRAEHLACIALCAGATGTRASSGSCCSSAERETALVKAAVVAAGAEQVGRANS